MHVCNDLSAYGIANVIPQQKKTMFCNIAATGASLWRNFFVMCCRRTPCRSLSEKFPWRFASNSRGREESWWEFYVIFWSHNTKAQHFSFGETFGAFFARDFATPHLGGHFGPEKNIWPPPPKKFPQFAADTFPAPPPPGEPPPPSWEFQIKKSTPPTLPAPQTPPSPSPSRKNKKYPKRPPTPHSKVSKIDRASFAPQKCGSNEVIFLTRRCSWAV